MEEMFVEPKKGLLDKLNQTKDGIEIKKIDGTVGIDEMKTIKLMASMELIKLLELVVPMKMEKGVQY